MRRRGQDGEKTILEVIGDTDGIAAGAAIEQTGSPALGLDAGEQAGIGRLGVRITDSIDTVLDDFDVLIDFTQADAVLENLERCRANGKKGRHRHNRSVRRATRCIEGSKRRNRHRLRPQHEHRRQPVFQTGGTGREHSRRQHRHRDYRGAP